MGHDAMSAGAGDHQLAFSGAASAPSEAEKYRFLCAVLSGSADLKLAPAGLRGPEGIERLIQLAERQLVTPVLHEAIAQHDPGDVPKHCRVILATQHEANRRRNQMLRDLTCELGIAAQQRGVDLVALKGCNWILEDRDGSAAWRWMLDIDLLVAPEHFELMPSLLAELGYSAIPIDRKFFGRRRFRGHFHLPPHTRTGIPTFVEVHRHIGWRPCLLPTELIFAHRRSVAPGLSLAVPWCSAFHAIVHWQIQDDGLRRLTSPLRKIFEVARYLQRADVDLDRLAHHAKSVGAIRELDVAVAFATELFDVRVPALLLPSETARRHVARCLAVRDSPSRMWLAWERGRVIALWQCDRAMYSVFLRGAGPAATKAALWAHRLVRLPALAGRAVYTALAGLVRMAWSEKARAT